MSSLLYSSLDIAAIISGMDLGCQAESRMLDRIWEGEGPLLEERYRENKRTFILDTHYWMHYFYDKPILDREFPAIKRDLEHSGYTIAIDRYISEHIDLDLFFKSVRIRILYGSGADHVRIKLRSLLAKYGYQRRSRPLMQHIDCCMRFYHLEATLRGGAPCDLMTCELDRMLTLRVI